MGKKLYIRSLFLSIHGLKLFVRMVLLMVYCLCKQYLENLILQSVEMLSLTGLTYKGSSSIFVIYYKLLRRGGLSVIQEYMNGNRSPRVLRYYERLNRGHFSML